MRLRSAGRAGGRSPPPPAPSTAPTSTSDRSFLLGNCAPLIAVAAGGDGMRAFGIIDHDRPATAATPALCPTASSAGGRRGWCLFPADSLPRPGRVRSMRSLTSNLNRVDSEWAVSIRMPVRRIRASPPASPAAITDSDRMISGGWSPLSANMLVRLRPRSRVHRNRIGHGLVGAFDLLEGALWLGSGFCHARPTPGCGLRLRALGGATMTAPDRPPSTASTAARRATTARRAGRTGRESAAPDCGPGRGRDDRQRLFGHDAPLHLEIGFGSGEHLAYRADLLPDHGFIGCEPFINGVATALTHIRDKHLPMSACGTAMRSTCCAVCRTAP